MKSSSLLSYPAAQGPPADPPLSLHSLEVKQVPFAFRLQKVANELISYLVFVH